MKIKQAIDKYFWTEKNPFSDKRPVNKKTVFIGLTTLLLLFFAIAPFIGGKEKSGPNLPNVTENGQGANNDPSNRLSDNPLYIDRIRLSHGNSRQYTASQIVRYADGNRGDKLPLGSTILAKLVNKLVSSDQAAPVIAEISDEVVWKNSPVIPQGTKAMGQASFDDSSKRLQIRFQTLVFPEGDQHQISALALLPDGSSGLSGNYHSGAFEKQSGQFLGNFVGGLAEGLMNKQPSGNVGLVYTPGSLSNGILNGLSKSAYDQAGNYAESMKNVRPYLEVEGGQPFLLYLEKEFP